MQTRTRISSQQLQLLALAAGSPWGFDNDQAYMAALCVPAKWDRKGPLPDVGKASVHRSLSKLLRGGFLHRVIHGNSHEERLWKLTVAGKALADRNGIEVEMPDPQQCATPEKVDAWRNRPAPVYV